MQSKQSVKASISPRVDYLFVYGTLKRCFNHPMHHLLTRYARYTGLAHIQANLYEIAGYPAAIPSDNKEEQVEGELYRIGSIDQKLLFAQLDAYEECSDAFPKPHEYVRSIVVVKDENNCETAAWSYLYNHSIEGRKKINSGRYLPQNTNL